MALLAAEKASELLLIKFDELLLAAVVAIGCVKGGGGGGGAGVRAAALAAAVPASIHLDNSAEISCEMECALEVSVRWEVRSNFEVVAEKSAKVADDGDGASPFRARRLCAVLSAFLLLISAIPRHAHHKRRRLLALTATTLMTLRDMHLALREDGQHLRRAFPTDERHLPPHL